MLIENQLPLIDWLLIKNNSLEYLRRFFVAWTFFMYKEKPNEIFL